MKILLLEDNQKLNEAITKRLKLKNYTVESFMDGAKAYERITEGFSCFILDINVPNVDGINILKKIREYYDVIPVIIISASVELDVIKQSYDFGCNDYLKKPFFIDELEIKIEKLLMNLFLSKKNQVITYSTIENYVWEGSFVSLESIRSLIRRVRKILNKEFIQTVVDTGYIFKNI